jgi:hypothetical protein
MSTQIIQPTYVTKQPSSGKVVKFRPFTVKEERSLLLALQEDSIETTIEAIKNVVSVCTSNTIDPESIPYYDVEYIFLQIRAKSVGEVIDLVGSCDCGPDKKTEFSIDVADVIITPTPKGTEKIKITDTNYTIEFRHPSIDDFGQNFNGAKRASETVVSNCIISVFTDDEVLDWTPTEKLEFVESMTTRQQKEIVKFLEDMPIVKLPTKYVCRHCGKEHTGNMSGFQNFFI